MNHPSLARQRAMPTFENLDNGHLKLLKDYPVETGFGWTIIVPKGFETDGASIPRWLWPFVGPPIRASYFDAALVHDYLCRLANSEGIYTLRALADVIFLHLLGQRRVSFVKSTLLYLGVRWYGRWIFFMKWAFQTRFVRWVFRAAGGNRVGRWLFHAFGLRDASRLPKEDRTATRNTLSEMEHPSSTGEKVA